MGQTVLLPFRRKACWEFFRPEKSDGFGRVWNPRTCVPKASTLSLHHRSGSKLNLLCDQLNITPRRPMGSDSIAPHINDLSITWKECRDSHPRLENLVHLDMTLCGPQRRSGCCGEENLQLRSVPSHYTCWVIPPPSWISLLSYVWISNICIEFPVSWYEGL